MAKPYMALVPPAAVFQTDQPRRLPKHRPNAETRAREYLTQAEVERLMKAAGENRNGHRADQPLRRLPGAARDPNGGSPTMMRRPQSRRPVRQKRQPLRMFGAAATVNKRPSRSPLVSVGWPTMSEAIDWYDQRAGDLSKRYEAIAAEKVHSWLLPSLPTSPALVLDVGAGSGRDAGWLISRGLEVVAIEPSARMLAEAQRLHPSPSIRWISDTLPGLERRIGMLFGGERSIAIHSALRDACDTIMNMPAHFITYPGGGLVFPISEEGGY